MVIALRLVDATLDVIDIYIREARVVLSKCNSLMNLRGGWLNWRARKDNPTFKAGHLRFNATIDDVL